MDNTFDYQSICNINMSKEERRKRDIGDIWSNEIECRKCKDIIRSKNKHHFVRCKCESIFIDGGSWYTRAGGK